MTIDLEKANSLCLEGNTDFASKKWTQAVKKYRSSLEFDAESKDSAKVYSNLAAALCKMGKYDEAYDAANQAPKVDPDWPKGYWRVGIVCELQRNFLEASSWYKKAVEHCDEGEANAKDKATFEKAMNKILDCWVTKEKPTMAIKSSKVQMRRRDPVATKLFQRRLRGNDCYKQATILNIWIDIFPKH